MKNLLDIESKYQNLVTITPCRSQVQIKKGLNIDLQNFVKIEGPEGKCEECGNWILHWYGTQR